MLRNGVGDVAAAPPTASQSDINTHERSAIGFTKPYAYARPMLAATAKTADTRGPAALKGARIVARRDSHAWQMLEKLTSDTGTALRLVPSPPDHVTDDFLDQVVYGDADFAALDEHRINSAMAWRNDVQPGLSLGNPVPRSWAVRRDNSMLLSALDEFIKTEYRGNFYNIIKGRYFRSTSPRAGKQSMRTKAGSFGQGRLSPFDEHTRKLADDHGFDWTFITAQIGVESRFDPKARSFAGARGLMQLMPATAKRFGVREHQLDDPHASIAAGVRYMSWLHQQFEPELTVHDRLWLTLASYNAGLGHVFDARRLARQLGLDANRWFGHVEKAIALLSRPRYYRQAEHGYARGHQTAVYVREVRDRYEGYRQLVSR